MLCLKKEFGVLACVVALATISGCGDLVPFFSCGPVSWKLRHEIRDKRSTVVDIAQLTDFEWDEFYVFCSYTSLHEICKTLAVDSESCKKRISFDDAGDGAGGLVFKNEGQIVYAEKHLDVYGEFSGCLGPLKRDQAVFDVTGLRLYLRKKN